MNALKLLISFNDMSPVGRSAFLCSGDHWHGTEGSLGVALNVATYSKCRVDKIGCLTKGSCESPKGCFVDDVAKHCE